MVSIHGVGLVEAGVQEGGMVSYNEDPEGAASIPSSHPVLVVDNDVVITDVLVSRCVDEYFS